MDKAPFHIPVFSNDYLILLNVNIPPGRNTGYHIHYAVVCENSAQAATRPGGSKT
jgi:hypothetical protein